MKAGLPRLRVGCLWSHRWVGRRPVLLLTDLDNAACPAALKSVWTGASTTPPGLLFRIVVREIEAWLLADHEAMVALLGSRIARELPFAPDGLPDPKAELIKVAGRGPRDVRLDICPAAGSRSLRGVNYNNRLVEFIQKQWDPDRAASRSPSLRRAREQLAALRGL